MPGGEDGQYGLVMAMLDEAVEIGKTAGVRPIGQDAIVPHGMQQFV